MVITVIPRWTMRSIGPADPEATAILCNAAVVIQSDTTQFLGNFFTKYLQFIDAYKLPAPGLLVY